MTWTVTHNDDQQRFGYDVSGAVATRSYVPLYVRRQPQMLALLGPRP